MLVFKPIRQDKKNYSKGISDDNKFCCIYFHLGYLDSATERKISKVNYETELEKSK